MSPKPSVVQCIVLHDIADDGVWFDTVLGKWQSTHLAKDVSLQMEILLRGGYVEISDEPIPLPSITPKGEEVLHRRGLSELIERLNQG